MFNELLEIVRTEMSVDETLHALSGFLPALDLTTMPESASDRPDTSIELAEEVRESFARALESARYDLVFPQKTLYVIDEPERHLHPTAQADVAEWVARLGEEAGAEVIVASHASAFLNLPSALVEYVLVYRDEDHITRTTPVTADVVGLLDEIAGGSGLSRADLIQLVRAFLIVEGANDRSIIEHFFGAELRHERVLIVPLHGSTKLRLLAEAEVIRRMGRLVFVLLDNTADETSAESRQIVQLLSHWPTDGSVPPPVPVRFAAPDIIRVFDDKAMSAAFRHLYSREWNGWGTIDKEFVKNPSSGWKRLLKRQLPNNASEDVLVDALLEVVPRHAPPAGLSRAMDEVLALASAAHSRRGVGGSMPTM